MPGHFRGMLAVAALALLAAACGDDDGGTTAPPSTAGGATTTTQAWGEAVAPGAEAMLEGSRVLLREDFQDGDTAGWRVDAGWFILENGERRMLGAGGEAWAWYEGGLSWTRYGVRLGMLLEKGSLGVSVAVGAEGRYVVHLAEDGVFLLKDAPYGAFSSLGSAQPVSLGEPHAVVVGIDGGHLQVYVDGVLLIDAVDAAPLAGGSIGLGAAAGSAVVTDNILVVGLGGPLPEAAAVAAPAARPLPEELSDGAPDAGEGLEEGEPAEPGVPNLAITGVGYPMEVRFGESFEVSIRVANLGAGRAGSFHVAFLSDDAECGGVIGGLAANEDDTMVCRFPGYAAAGSDSHEWMAAADSEGVIDEGAREDDNLAVGTIYLATGGGEPVLPNLTCGAAALASRPLVGEPAHLQVVIAQTESGFQGTLPPYGVGVSWQGELLCSGTVEPGDDTFACDLPPFAEVGNVELSVEIDRFDNVAEADEQDNVDLIDIAVAASAVAEPATLNVYLSQVRFDPPAPVAGEPFDMLVSQLSDRPEVAVPLHTIRLLVDGVVVCSKDVAWTTGATICPISGLSAGDHRWEANVDADDDIDESDESDNSGAGQFTVLP